MGERVEIAGPAAVGEVGGGPGLVVLHEWWGLVPHIEDVCDRFGVLGYTAVAPDLFHGERVPDREPDLAEQLILRLDRERAAAEVAAVVAALRDRGCARVGVVGFCTGGAAALAASAVCRVDATVSYYGIWPMSGERTITSPILVHTAEHEEHNWLAMPDVFPRWFAGMGNVEIHHHPGTQHAFFDDSRPDGGHDPAAAALSWERTTAFLRQHLVEPPPDGAAER